MYAAPETILLNGTEINKNAIPPVSQNAVIRIPGDNGEVFGIDEDTLSKHILLIGGTGTGKTNLFYHIVTQLKKKLTSNDVMIIFDTKGDFETKFYDKTKDYIIGNTQEYKKR